MAIMLETSLVIEIGVRVFCPDASRIGSERVDAFGEAVAIDVRSKSDAFSEKFAKLDAFVARGTTYAVAIDPSTREVVTLGKPPKGLSIDTDGIIDG